MTTKIVPALSSAEADSIVLPELAFTGYFFQDRSELASLAEEYFDPGNTPLKTIELRGVRIGIMVCFDWAFPEVARVLALQGADLLCHPSNLVLAHCQKAMVTRCLENSVFAVTANRFGIETTIAEQPSGFYFCFENADMPTAVTILLLPVRVRLEYAKNIIK